MNTIQSRAGTLLTVSLCLVFNGLLFAKTDELDKKATWQIPTHQSVQESIQAWLEKQQLDSEMQQQVDEIWTGAENEASDGLLLRAVHTFSLFNEDADRLFRVCRKRKVDTRLPDVAFLSDEQHEPIFRNNMRLFYGQWLALNQLYNELDQTLEGLKPTDVIDPASLLFFQAVSHHRLLNKDEALPLLERLLEKSDSIPSRYATMARLMEADIKPLKEDSLDEISRLMDSIKVRLAHGRAGARVRKEEDDVIAKLDKMIEDLEKKAQQQQQSSSSSQSQDGKKQNQSTNPMEDSKAGGVSGPGNVDPKKLKEDAEWGDLPPKEREEALQRLSKDLPSHYRDVIEQYFQKLAKEEQ